MDKLSGLHAECCGGFFQLEFDGGVRPFGKTRERGAECLETVGGTRFGEAFGHGLRIKRILFGKQKTDPVGNIAQVFDFWFDDGQRGAQRLEQSVGNTGFFHKRQRQFLESLQAHVLDVLAVEPKTFVEVEDRVPAVDMAEVEKREDLRGIQKFPVFSRRPPEQTEIICDGFRRVAEVEKIGDARPSVPLAELFSLVIQDERNVRELRWRGADCLVELDVFWRVREVILAADHVRELHFDVIHDIHKVKNPRPVRAPDRHVRMSRGV